MAGTLYSHANQKSNIMKKTILWITLLILSASGTGNRNLGGIVTDAAGNPLAGVNVGIKGTMDQTRTDANGRFSLFVAQKTPVLVFSYLGYLTREVKSGLSDTLIVVLHPDQLSLQEVVVTGYSARRDGRKAAGAAAANATYDMAAPGIYPAAENGFNTEGYSAIHENGFRSPLRAPLSTFSIDVDAASYSNMRRFILNGQKPVMDAIRIEEMINYFDYDYPQPDNGHPFAMVHELGTCPWNKNNLLLHIGLQGKKLETAEAPPSNLVFLIDVSGSMDEPNKLPLLVNAMKMLTSQLRSKDRVAIVVYAGSSGLVLPSTPGNRKEEIAEALDRLRAGGSTAGAEGLKLAYEIAEMNFIHGGNNRIILATDGDFNVGPSSNAEMERMIEAFRGKGIFISVAGFGMGNYKDDKMEIIADKGNGNYAYIDNLMEARKVFVKEFTGTLFAIAKDVKIQVEFNPAYVKEYRLVGYENRLLNEEDFENDKKDAGELGAGHSVTALYEIVPASAAPGNVRQLKYQQTNSLPPAGKNGEMATIHFRYKLPEADNSILLTETVTCRQEETGEMSDNFRFSAAVAGFGMLLRNSEYNREMSFSDILQMARASRGNDPDGYRSEFIRLVELSHN